MPQSPEGFVNGRHPEKQRVRHVPRVDIGKRLRELRAAKGLSQYVIARRTGILRCNIWRMEKGQVIPGLETLKRFAGALEIELYQLFFAGEGKAQLVSTRNAAKLGPEECGILKALKNLDKTDRNFIVAMAKKMAKGNRTAG